MTIPCHVLFKKLQSTLVVITIIIIMKHLLYYYLLLLLTGTLRPSEGLRLKGRDSCVPFISRLYQASTRIETGRVLARDLEMPVQNSNSKSSAHPDLASQPLQVLIPTRCNSLLCQKGKLTIKPCLRRCLIRKKSWLFFTEVFACP